MAATAPLPVTAVPAVATVPCRIRRWRLRCSSGYGGGGGYGQANYGGFPNFFSNPALFGPVPSRVLDGSGQVFTQNAGPYANQFTNLTNGVNAGLFQGNSQTDPSLRGVTSVLRNEFGLFYGYVGPVAVSPVLASVVFRSPVPNLGLGDQRD
ncbi:MAG: hypothetical protein R2857_05875 [Vampirovibrionales bacterium]